MARAGEYGVFTPTEAAYTGPGEFERSVLGEATKRGTFLSQLAQFEEELEERQREFESTLEFKEKELTSEEKRWGEQLAWYREQEAGRLGLEREQIAAQKYISRAGTRVSDAERRRAAAGWNVPAEEEGEIPLSWLSEQIGRMYSSEVGGVGEGPGSYEAPTRIFFSNPALGMREEV